MDETDPDHDPRNCNCGKPKGKPQRMRVQGGKITYLGERGQPVKVVEAAPAEPTPPPEAA